MNEKNMLRIKSGEVIHPSTIPQGYSGVGDLKHYAVSLHHPASLRHANVMASLVADATLCCFDYYLTELPYLGDMRVTPCQGEEAASLVQPSPLDHVPSITTDGVYYDITMSPNYKDITL